MGLGRLILAVGAVAAIGGTVWYFYNKNKKAASTAAGSAGQAESVTKEQSDALIKNTVATVAAQDKNTFCNPPVFGSDPIDTAAQKIAYQRKMSDEAWDKQGRGMNPDYWFQLYKQQMGC